MAVVSERKPTFGGGFEIFHVPFMGRGTGGTNPTTVVVDNTISLAFANGDLVYLRWALPERLDRTVDIILRTRWYTQGAEASKNISLDLNTKSYLEGGVISGTTGTVQVVNQAIPSVLNTSFLATFTLSAATYLTTPVALGLRLGRVSSSANPAANPALYSVAIRYKLASL